MQVMNAININSDIFTNIIENNSINKSEVSSQSNSKIKFEDVITNTISKVNESQINANNMIESLIKGEDVTMHEVMLSMQESQMSMQLMLEVRNKLFEAYQQLNGVQL